MVAISEFCKCLIVSDGKNTPATTAEIISVVDILRPKPSSHNFMRIGGNSDGSYLIPDDLENIAACFSPGVNNFKNFEDYLVDHYGIRSHMCDFTSDLAKFKTPLKEGMQTFQKKWLDVDGSDDSITLEDWVNDRAPSGDLLMQMDIEGAEYRNILSVPREILSRFRILIFEVHSLHEMLNSAILRQVIAPFFEKIAQDFVCIHAHPNNCCGEFAVPGTEINVPKLLELTFIRRDRLDRAGEQFPVLLPHPLDVGRNVPGKPPLFLGAGWYDGELPLLSRVKMLEDQIDFEKYLRVTEAAARQKEFSLGFDLILRSFETTVQKFEVKDEPQSNLREVAAGCKFVLSSAYRKGGNVGTVAERGRYFFSTAFGFSQFIRIDLGRTHDIRKIVIKNRIDGFQDRARPLLCTLSNQTDVGSGSVFAINGTKEFLSGEALELDIPLPSTQARFVTIFSPAYTMLHFAAIEVFAAAD